MNPVSFQDQTRESDKINAWRSLDENPRLKHPNENQAKIIKEQSKRIFAPFHPCTNKTFDSDIEFDRKVKKLYENFEKKNNSQ